MLGYLWAFLGGLVIDSIPVFAPPAWTLIVLLVLKLKLDPWIATAAGAAGSTIGRYALSKFMPLVAGRVLSAHENANVKFLGKKLDGRFWTSFAFVLVYSLTPLSTTALFTAVGTARVDPLPILPAFLLGKFGSDALMIVGGKHVVRNVGDMFKGESSPKGLVFAAIGALIMAAVLFVDWKELLTRRKFRLDFRIWRTHERG